jgi:hypothetical protein
MYQLLYGPTPKEKTKEQNSREKKEKSQHHRMHAPIQGRGVVLVEGLRVQGYRLGV